MEYYSAMKNNETMPFAATWMDLDSVLLRESKSDQEDIISYDICGIYLKRNDTSELMYKTETDSQAFGFWGQG